jgi:hypothetical protein
MSKLLIINGITYEVSSSKLQYAIDTQFNYFKFPPRIKSVTPSDALDLGDTLDTIDIVSAQYYISEDAGQPVSPGSEAIVYRAGDYSTDVYNTILPDGRKNPTFPLGYTVYQQSNDKRDHGGWLIPTKLDMGAVINGEPLVKPNTFIVTPEMIELGENIYFNIQVAMRVSLNEGWVNIQESENPLAVITPGSLAEYESYSRIAVPRPYENFTWETGFDNTYNFDNMTYDMDKLSPWYNKYAPYVRSNWFNENVLQQTHKLAIQNSVLVELRVHNAADGEAAVAVKKQTLGALAGTFDPKPSMEKVWYSSKAVNDVNLTDPKFDFRTYNAGWEIELEINTLIQQISKFDEQYKSLNTIYNNLLTFISDRSTTTQLNELATAKTNLENSQIELNNAVTQLDNKQKQLKNARVAVLNGKYNPYQQPTYKSLSSGVYGPDFFYDVEKLHPVKSNNPAGISNRDNMLYKIKYMIDIKKAKPYDEYYIETSAGTPYNLLYKDRTYWQIVPQSKLSTLI